MAEGFVLVDSSIWVDVFRPDPPGEMKRVLTGLVESGRAALTEMIRLEVMAGARSFEEFGEFRTDLDEVFCLETTSREWRGAEDLSFVLKRAGQKVAAADLLIAAVAVSHRVPLWHADRDFERIRQVRGTEFRALWYPKQSPSI